MKILSTQVAILLCSKPYADARALGQLTSKHIQDIDYDPDLLAKYYNDIFQTLKEKYEESDRRPISSHDVLEDLQDILIDFCPSHETQQKDSCIRDIIEYVENESHPKNKEDDEAVRSILSDNVMDRLEHAMYIMDSKQDSLNEIDSLKEEFDKNDIKGKVGLTALSFAAETYGIWFDVYNDEKHPLRMKGENGARKLQTRQNCVWNSFIDGVKLVVLTLYEVGNLVGAVFTAFTMVLETFLNGCPASTDMPTSAPIVKVTDRPVGVIIDPTAAPVTPTAVTSPPTVTLVTSPPTVTLVTSPPTVTLVTSPPTVTLVTSPPTVTLVTSPPTVTLVTSVPTAENVTLAPTTQNVTFAPTSDPTAEETAPPTSEPTSEPTSDPTAEETAPPTSEPTSDPTAEETAAPTTEETAPDTSL